MRLPPRIEALLITGGPYHDMDHARLSLLGYMAEHERMRVTVRDGYAADDIAAADVIVTYTCDRVPDTAALDALTVVPNPFRSSARASFAVSEAQAVTVTLYDVMGRQVQQVFSGAAQAEQAIEVSVDGSSLAAGVYVLVLQGETVRATRQVTVAR